MSVLDQPLSFEKLSNNYSSLFLRLLQIVFGTEEILSQGGYESVDLMFRSIHLNRKKILDIGSGFGGVDIYLAEQFNVEILGVDMEPYMVAKAKSYLKRHPALLGSVSFQTLQQPYSLQEFNDETFDLIFSKEAFYNIPKSNKQSYLAEMYRKLKKGGELLISDWLQSSPIPGDTLKRTIQRNEKFCQFVTPQNFQNMLEEELFEDICFIDHSQEHIKYSIADCQRLDQNMDSIVTEFGKEAYEHAVQSFQSLLKSQLAGDLLSGLFIAKKL